MRETDTPPVEDAPGRKHATENQYAGEGTGVTALQDCRKRNEHNPAAGDSQRSDDAGSTPPSDGSASAPVAVSRIFNFLTLHIESVRPDTFCGASGSRIALVTLARHYRVAFVIMTMFGCRECMAELRDALRNARRIS